MFHAIVYDTMTYFTISFHSFFLHWYCTSAFCWPLSSFVILFHQRTFILTTCILISSAIRIVIHLQYIIQYTICFQSSCQIGTFDGSLIHVVNFYRLRFATQSVTKQTLRTCKIKILEACHFGMSMHAQSCSSSHTLERQYIPRNIAVGCRTRMD